MFGLLHCLADMLKKEHGWDKVSDVRSTAAASEQTIFHNSSNVR